MGNSGADPQNWNKGLAFVPLAFQELILELLPLHIGIFYLLIPLHYNRIKKQKIKQKNNF